MFALSSCTCNRRSHLWDYVEPGEVFCYFLRIVSPTGCLVLLLSFYVFLFSFSCSVSFPDVMKTCHSTSVCQALRNQIYTNTLASDKPPVSKHIDVRYHFIRELVKHKVIAIKYTESRNQHADTLTKAIGTEGFARHRSFPHELA